MMGAWPVYGFFGLDVGLIYYAFKRNYRYTHKLQNDPHVADLLKLLSVHPSRGTRRVRFQ